MVVKKYKELFHSQRLLCIYLSIQLIKMVSTTDAANAISKLTKKKFKKFSEKLNAINESRGIKELDFSNLNEIDQKVCTLFLLAAYSVEKYEYFAEIVEKARVKNIGELFRVQNELNTALLNEMIVLATDSLRLSNYDDNGTVEHTTGKERSKTSLLGKLTKTNRKLKISTAEKEKLEAEIQRLETEKKNLEEVLSQRLAEIQRLKDEKKKLKEKSKKRKEEITSLKSQIEKLISEHKSVKAQLLKTESYKDRTEQQLKVVKNRSLEIAGQLQTTQNKLFVAENEVQRLRQKLERLLETDRTNIKALKQSRQRIKELEEKLSDIKDALARQNKAIAKIQVILGQNERDTADIRRMYRNLQSEFAQQGREMFGDQFQEDTLQQMFQTVRHLVETDKQERDALTKDLQEKTAELTVLKDAKPSQESRILIKELEAELDRTRKQLNELNQFMSLSQDTFTQMNQQIRSFLKKKFPDQYEQFYADYKRKYGGVRPDKSKKELFKRITTWVQSMEVLSNALKFTMDQRSELQQQLRAKEQQNERLQTVNDELRSQLSTLQEKQAAFREENPDANKEIEVLNQKLARAQARYEQLDHEYGELRVQFEKAVQDNNDVHKSLDVSLKNEERLIQRMEGQETQIKIMRQTINDLKERNARDEELCRVELEEKDKQLQKKTLQFKTLMQKHATLTKQHKQSIVDLQTLQDKFVAAKNEEQKQGNAEVSELKGKLAEKKETIANLQERFAKVAEAYRKIRNERVQKSSTYREQATLLGKAERRTKKVEAKLIESERQLNQSHDENVRIAHELATNRELLNRSQQDLSIANAELLNLTHQLNDSQSFSDQNTNFEIAFQLRQKTNSRNRLLGILTKALKLGLETLGFEQNKKEEIDQLLTNPTMNDEDVFTTTGLSKEQKDFITSVNEFLRLAREAEREADLDFGLRPVFSSTPDIRADTAFQVESQTPSEEASTGDPQPQDLPGPLDPWAGRLYPVDTESSVAAIGDTSLPGVQTPSEEASSQPPLEDAPALEETFSPNERVVYTRTSDKKVFDAIVLSKKSKATKSKPAKWQISYNDGTTDITTTVYQSRLEKISAGMYVSPNVFQSKGVIVF